MTPADDSTRRGLLDAPGAFFAILVAATLLAAALRLYGLGGPSFWVDEFFTIARSGTDPLHVAQVIGYLPTQISLWLHGAELDRIGLASIEQWPSLGVTERAARLGPCWVAIVTVPALALLARPVLGAGTAGVSALLLAITPWHLYWSQMARFYGIQFLFANAFVLLFARGMQTGRGSWFTAAGVAGLLGILSHPTTILVIGAVVGALLLAWLLRLPLPHLGSGAKCLGLLVVAFALIVVSREFPLLAHGVEAPEPSSQPEVPEAESELGNPLWLLDKANQSWGPSPGSLALSTILRIEPITCAVGIVWAIVGVRRRDFVWILVGAVAVLVPLGAMALSVVFPIGPRYYFPSLFAWTLLAAMWATEIDRRLAPGLGRLAGCTAALALLVAVGLSTFHYTRDGAGARARWRDAYAFVLSHGSREDPIYRTGSGAFQARYYFGRDVPSLSSVPDVAALAPGTWVIQRSRGTRAPKHADLLQVRARYEIPSKPWSWVVHVTQVPDR